MSKANVEFGAVGLLSRLESIANERYDGHLVIMKFTTNWRIGFYPPDGREAIQEMVEGKTFSEAAEAAIKAAGLT